MKSIFVLFLLFVFNELHSENLKTVWWHDGVNYNISGCAVSTDGKYVYTSIYSMKEGNTKIEIQEWEIESGNLKRTFPVNQLEDYIDISPDGKYLTAYQVTSVPNVDVIDLEAGTFLRTDQPTHGTGMNNIIWNVKILPGGKKYAVVLYTTMMIEVIDLVTGKQDYTIGISGGKYNSTVFNKSGSLFASIQDTFYLRIWNTSNGSMVDSVRLDKKYFLCDITEDGSMALMSFTEENKTIMVLIKLEDMTIEGEWADEKYGGLSYDSKYIIAQTDFNSYSDVFAIGYPNFKKKISYYTRSTIAISKNSYLVSFVSYDKKLYVYDFDHGSLLLETSPFYREGHSGTVFKARYEPGGKALATCGEDGIVKIWDKENGVLKKSLFLVASHITGLCYTGTPNPARWLVAGTSTGNIHVFDAKNNYKFSNQRDGLPSAIEDIIPLRDDWTERVAVAGRAGTIGLLTLGGGTPLWADSVIKNVNCANFSPDGSFFASGTKDKKVCIYMFFHPLYVKPLFEKLVILNASKGTSQNTTGIVNVQFFPDNRSVASASSDENVLRIWDVDEYNEKENLNLFLSDYNFGNTQAFELTKDGKYLIAAGSSGIIGIWDLETKLIKAISDTVMQRNKKEVYPVRMIKSLTVSDDSRLVAVVCDDGTVFTLDISSLESSISNHIEDNTSKLFPNPCKESINVSCTTINPIFNCIIYSATGLKINCPKIERSDFNTEFDVSNLCSGVYYIKYFLSGNWYFNKFIKL